MSLLDGPKRHRLPTGLNDLRHQGGFDQPRGTRKIGQNRKPVLDPDRVFFKTLRRDKLDAVTFDARCLSSADLQVQNRFALGLDDEPLLLIVELDPEVDESFLTVDHGNGGTLAVRLDAGWASSMT